MSSHYKVSVLVFMKNEAGDFLLMHRNKSPNKGCWSPIGGKLDMETGESPHQCAVREIKEETNLDVEISDLHLFSMIAEKNYEGHGHWLLFLFDCKKPLPYLPENITEGDFAFYSRQELESLPLPETDRNGLWATYDAHRDGFVAMRADCTPDKKLEIILEEAL